MRCSGKSNSKSLFFTAVPTQLHGLVTAFILLALLTASLRVKTLSTTHYASWSIINAVMTSTYLRKVHEIAAGKLNDGAQNNQPVGGTGRRAGFKIRFLCGSAGSIPALGTN